VIERSPPEVAGYIPPVMKATMSVTLLTLALLAAGCGLIGGENGEAETGLAGAQACMEEAGATKLMPSDEPGLRNLAGRTAGGFIFTMGSSSTPGVNADSAIQQRDLEPGFITWLTLDNKVVLGVEKGTSYENWEQSARCAELLPDRPGKLSWKSEGPASYYQAEFNQSRIERNCGFKPGAAWGSILRYSLETYGVNPDVWEPEADRLAFRFAKLTDQDPSTGCERFALLESGL
jgi:hypothetical protein